MLHHMCRHTPRPLTAACHALAVGDVAPPSPSPLSQFNQHVIIETNKTTERIFPAVPDVEHPEFFVKMDKLVQLNNKVRGGCEL